MKGSIAIFRALCLLIFTFFSLVTVSAQGPEILSVSVPNEPMGLGDEVKVAIAFAPHILSDEFVYEKGTIEGLSLNEGSLNRTDQTTYTASITIREDTPNRTALQRLRVRDFLFSSGGVEGPVFEDNIDQDNDEIDTQIPVVEYIRFWDGELHGIGSPVSAEIRADGPDYQFDLSRSWINGVSFSASEVEVENNLDSTYRVIYTPEEGDRDVLPDEEIEVEIVMLDNAGNRNDPPLSTLYNNWSPVIDASSPSLDSAVVQNPGVKTTGDRVEILLYASEELAIPDPALEGSHVNYVPISSGRVSFSEYGGRVYRLDYVVGSGDAGVRLGELGYNIEMEDLAGNRSHSNIALKNNGVSIGTGVPTASISGGGNVCTGDSLASYLYLTGEAPWDVVIEHHGGDYAHLEVESSPYKLWLKASETDTFRIARMVDGSGITGNTFGVAIMGIHTSTTVDILLDQGTYLSSDPGVELNASWEPGVFSGSGVSGGYFYPGVAGTENSPHSIFYHYRNSNGCSSYDTVEVSVIEGSGSVLLLDGEDPVSILCDDQGSYILSGTNLEGASGSFELRITNTTTVVEGAITDSVPEDNLAEFNPAGLEGAYDIIYSWELDGVELTASTFVKLELIDTLFFIAAPGDISCRNDAEVELEGNMDHVDPYAQWIFSGPGVSGGMQTAYEFDPSDPSLEPGPFSLDYEYITEGGCRAKISAEYILGYYPGVDFEVNTACISSSGGEIEFNNTTSGKFSVASWNWDFGDHSSGEANYSQLEHPTHFYASPGMKHINLTATTHEGCISYHQLDTLLADRPDVDFTWVSDCFTRGSKANFINSTDASYSPLDTLVWTFTTLTGSVLGELGASPDQDTVQIPFSSTGNYGVSLYARNMKGCHSTAKHKFILQPSLKLASAALHEDFDKSEGNWVSNSDDGNESWVWGVPDFKDFSAEPGDRAWYTVLPETTEDYEEQSWLQSPCYDFSDLRRPMIQLDIMKSFIPEMEGVVLQYQDKVEEGWKSIGLYDEGLGWYNSPLISSRPGGSAFGWGLKRFEPDTSWVTAWHHLDSLAGKEQVKLRFALGSTGRNSIGNQGFAFNNLSLADRKRKAVIEYFTNSADINSGEADIIMDAYYQDHSLDLIDLQYHMSYPGSDPMNESNPSPASTRAGALGVGQVPYAVLNGSLSEACRYNFTSSDYFPGGEKLMESVLLADLPFRIQMAVDWKENNLTADLEVVCLSDSYPGNIQLYVVIIESEVTSYTGENGDSSFRNVVLDMLPTPAGKLLGADWYRGKVDKRSYSWDLVSYIEDVEDLGVVAFIQDRESGEILQASSEHLNSGVGFQEKPVELLALHLYPNPASQWVKVLVGEAQRSSGKISLMDLSGRVLKEMPTRTGEQEYSLSLEGLSSGLYLVCWYEAGVLRGRSKLICGRSFH